MSFADVLLIYLLGVSHAAVMFTFRQTTERRCAEYYTYLIERITNDRDKVIEYKELLEGYRNLYDHYTNKFTFPELLNNILRYVLLSWYSVYLYFTECSDYYETPFWFIEEVSEKVNNGKE